MGLSSSQARLLTLTNRQHSLEWEAQRIQANKLRLANDTDQAYFKYLNALDETVLQTKQTSKKTGANCWIDGSLNNLLRYGTSEDYSGNVFYAQDTETGELYLPQIFVNNYNNSTASGDVTKMRDFVHRCDSSIEYEKVDHNAYLIDALNDAIARGYNVAANDTMLAEYQQRAFNDYMIINPAQRVLDAMPPRRDGIYVTSGESYDFSEAIKSLRSQSNYSTVYNSNEQNLLESSLTIMNNIGKTIPTNKTINIIGYEDTSCDSEKILDEVLNIVVNNSQTITSMNTAFYVGTPPSGEKVFLTVDKIGSEHINAQYQVVSYYASQPATPTGTERYNIRITQEYEAKNVTAERDGVTYEQGKLVDDDKYLSAMLNGGTFTWDGKVTTRSINNATLNTFGHWGEKVVIGGSDSKNLSFTSNVYDMDISLSSGAVTKGSNILSALGNGCSTYGDAIKKILTNKINATHTAQDYLRSIGKTEEDMENYQKYLQIQTAADSYVPDIEWIPNEKAKAEYYETMFKAIEAAGGVKVVSDKNAKSTSWVGNMIKSAQIILTTWDVEKEMLSTTSPSLNTHIQEVNDKNLIEKVEQEYEAEIDLINAKDTRFDNRLQVLESERDAISTEIDSLKQIMKANIDTTFKVFS